MFSKTVKNNVEVTGIFKDVIRLKNKEQISKEGDKELM